MENKEMSKILQMYFSVIHSVEDTLKKKDRNVLMTGTWCQKSTGGMKGIKIIQIRRTATQEI